MISLKQFNNMETNHFSSGDVYSSWRSVNVKFAKYLLLMYFFFFFSKGNSYGQKLVNYFKYEGVRSLAEFAHPSNTYKTGSFLVYPDYFGPGDDMIIVDIYYQENYYTQLAIRKQAGLFTRLAVVKDNDFIPAFSAVTLLKSILAEYIKNENKSIKNDLELQLQRLLKRKLIYSNGMDITLFVLNVDWLKY